MPKKGKKVTQTTKVVTENGLGAFYCLGSIGAAVYWIQQTEGFWNVILALLKAAVWPAFVVHKALELLNL